MRSRPAAVWTPAGGVEVAVASVRPSWVGSPRSNLVVAESMRGRITSQVLGALGEQDLDRRGLDDRQRRLGEPEQGARRVALDRRLRVRDPQLVLLEQRRAILELADRHGQLRVLADEDRLGEQLESARRRRAARPAPGVARSVASVAAAGSVAATSVWSRVSVAAPWATRCAGPAPSRRGSPRAASTGPCRGSRSRAPCVPPSQAAAAGSSWSCDDPPRASAWRRAEAWQPAWQA